MMDRTGSQPDQPGRDALESDPAYDFAEDAPVDDADLEDDEVLEEPDGIVPLDEADFLGDEKPVVPLDADEFREPDEDE
jgi:hypothetical protein